MCRRMFGNIFCHIIFAVVFTQMMINQRKLTAQKIFVRVNYACVTAYVVGFDFGQTFKAAFLIASRWKKALGSGFSHIYGCV